MPAGQSASPLHLGTLPPVLVESAFAPIVVDTIVIGIGFVLLETKPVLMIGIGFVLLETKPVLMIGIGFVLLETLVLV